MSGLFDPVERKVAGSAERDAALVTAYLAAGRTLDDLPYTPEFEAVWARVGPDWPDRAGMFRRLHNLRKAKRLPKLGRGQTPPIKVTAEEQDVLAVMVVQRVGTLGQRDQLVYETGMELLVHEFNARVGRDLTPHDVWRLIAKIAK